LWAIFLLVLKGFSIFSISQTIPFYKGLYGKQKVVPFYPKGGKITSYSTLGTCFVGSSKRKP